MHRLMVVGLTNIWKCLRLRQLMAYRIGLLLTAMLMFGGNKPDFEAVMLASGECYSLNHAIRINPVDSAILVFVPAGEFIMGSDPEDIDHMWKKFHWNDEEKAYTKGEQPAHHVHVDGFWMYQSLVAVSQYRRYCTTTDHSMPDIPSYGWSESNPMVNVNWQEACDYCSWAGGRLPYEAEWEYAARGGNSGVDDHLRTTFVWGDTLPLKPVANLADETFITSGYYDHPNFHSFEGYEDGYATVSPIASFPPNGFGLYDMAGNVLEWCKDWYAEDYYLNAPPDNPHGPTAGSRRVLRGGAFDTTPTITRISRRLSNNPEVRHEEKGFRCVQSL